MSSESSPISPEYSEVLDYLAKKEKKKVKISEEKMDLFTYKEFYAKKIDLETYSFHNLKDLAKHNNLGACRSKKDTIDRISNYFSKNQKSEKIQSIYRGYLAKHRYQLIKSFNFSNCINDRDFHSWEDLADIPRERYFVYTDEKGFSYGFDILSLILLLKKESPENPYNREKFSEISIKQMISFYSTLLILYPEYYKTHNCLSPRSIFLISAATNTDSLLALSESIIRVFREEYEGTANLDHILARLHSYRESRGSAILGRFLNRSPIRT